MQGQRARGPPSQLMKHEVFERRKINSPLCADLIDDYERDPVATKHRLRRQPGLREYFIGHLFALVVFHSDSFAVINESLAHPDTERFFKITSQLPLDLQMVLCNQIFGSPRDIILSRDSEPGFQLLTRTTTWIRTSLPLARYLRYLAKTQSDSPSFSSFFSFPRSIETPVLLSALQLGDPTHAINTSNLSPFFIWTSCEQLF